MRWRVQVGEMKPNAAMASQLSQVLSSGWFSPGPKVAEFERKFAEAHNAKYAVMVNSGTDALRIGLLALKELNGWGPADEVIVPAATFVATYNIVRQSGMKPVLCDVDEKTFCLEPERIVKAMSSRTRAVIPVHLFGLSCPMPSPSLGLSVLEDSCESVGDVLRGDVAAYSTYACHVISTGVGGVILTNDEKTLAFLRSYANHGRDPLFLGGLNGDGMDPKDLINRRFSFLREGYSARSTEFQAAVGIPQIDSLATLLARRGDIAYFYRKEFSPLVKAGVIQIQDIPIGRHHAHMMFPIILNQHDRAEVCVELEKDGIETRTALPLVTQPMYSGYWTPTDYPNAYRLATQGFYVGCHQDMTIEDAAYVVDRLSHVLKREVTLAA